MVSVLSTNITSPLGFTTEQNYQAVLSGRSALKCYEGLWGLQEPFAASLFSEEQNAALAISGYTRLESLAIRSAQEALSHTELDVASERIVLILSTTKADIGRSPSEAAGAIAKALGLTREPIVVCNACVSGVSAQLLADSLLSAGLYDYAIVVGAEVQSRFIVSGFQSLKAVSDAPCRPFDIERNGLNLGEAAATIVFSRNGDGVWHLVDGAARNDAYHIVSPSPVGDGLTAAIEAVMQGQDKTRLATVCVHGTATLYNDQMESKAIQRAGLSDVPLSALKGYYGHTMGAAGVLETILTMRATDDGIVLPSKGFTELGVSEKVCIGKTQQPVSVGEKRCFLKLISGFGGCNVAALYARGTMDYGLRTMDDRLRTMDCGLWTKTHTVRLSSGDGKSLNEIYREQIGNYPKFHKMDILSRLAFVATETLSPLPRNGESLPSITGGDGGGSAIILFNHSSSIVSDRQYLSTISDADNFFPSPSVFVYTLPNIAAGEIAIRHHCTDETSFYILQEKNETLMQQILDASLRASNVQSVISGWIDAESETSYECELSTYEKE
ncbi:MAG: 3-oxoacyl-ACP synthase [Bacteroidaceae bacterium]|nr:3-oxoacyl-ACP synthase [Bacteroidaceae bacterium]